MPARAPDWGPPDREGHVVEEGRPHVEAEAGAEELEDVHADKGGLELVLHRGRERLPREGVGVGAVERHVRLLPDELHEELHELPLAGLGQLCCGVGVGLGGMVCELRISRVRPARKAGRQAGRGLLGGGAARPGC